MRKNRFYLDETFHVTRQYELTKDVHHQIRHVLRLKHGGHIELFNGRNQVANALLETINKTTTQVKIESIEDINRESPVHIHLGQVIGKGTKMDFVIQKATELGVKKITPLYSEYGMVRYKADKTMQKIEHWQKVAIAACAQCERNQLPTIAAPLSIQEWLQTLKTDASLKLLLSPNTNKNLMSIDKASSVTLLIGPEGGLSGKEETLALDSDFTGIQLGPRILRTETASIAALSLIQVHSGDFS